MAEENGPVPSEMRVGRVWGTPKNGYEVSLYVPFHCEWKHYLFPKEYAVEELHIGNLIVCYLAKESGEQVPRLKKICRSGLSWEEPHSLEAAGIFSYLADMSLAQKKLQLKELIDILISAHIAPKELRSFLGSFKLTLVSPLSEPGCNCQMCGVRYNPDQVDWNFLDTMFREFKKEVTRIDREFTEQLHLEGWVQIGNGLEIYDKKGNPEKYIFEIRKHLDFLSRFLEEPERGSRIDRDRRFLGPETWERVRETIKVEIEKWTEKLKVLESQNK